MADEISAKLRLPGWATSRWASSGWATVFGTVAILFLATGCNCDNPNGAIHARVTQNGLDYVNSVLPEMLDKELRRITIPDMSIKIPYIRYVTISNISIPNPQWGAASKNKILSTPSGVRWTLSFQELKLTGNWKKYFWWYGNFTMIIRNMNLGVTLRPTTVNGKLAVLPASVVPSNCATIGDVDFQYDTHHRIWDFLSFSRMLNMFKGTYLGNILGTNYERDIPPQVCAAAGEALHEWTAKIFPNMKTTDAIKIADKWFLVDYGLLDPTFQTGLTTIRFKGEVWPSPKTFASFPFSPSPLPPLPRPASKHVYLTVSDFVANSLLFSAQKKGIGSETFDSPEIKRLLSQFCSEQPTCDFNALSFSTRIVEAPNMDFSRSKGVTLKLKGCEMVVTEKLGDVGNNLVRVTIDVTVSAQPALSQDGRNLTFTFSAPVIHFDLIHPEIPPAQEQLIKNLAGAVLNCVGAKGIELPNIKGHNVNIIDHELTVDDGALVLGANVVLKL